MVCFPPSPRAFACACNGVAGRGGKVLVPRTKQAARERPLLLVWFVRHRRLLLLMALLVSLAVITHKTTGMPCAGMMLFSCLYWFWTPASSLLWGTGFQPGRAMCVPVCLSFVMMNDRTQRPTPPLPYIHTLPTQGALVVQEAGQHGGSGAGNRRAAFVVRGAKPLGGRPALRVGCWGREGRRKEATPAHTQAWQAHSYA